MPPRRLFELLDAWVARGWLRALDRAFAAFLHAQRPEASGAALLAAALVSHQLGRGHICLDLRAVLEDPEGTLSLPPEGDPGEAPPPGPSVILADFSREAWEENLAGSALVGQGEGNTPLVLDAGRLYLRRYWRYTVQVARGIRQRLERDLAVPEDLAGRLDRLFGPLRDPAERDKSAVHWQSVAAAVAARSAFSVICGGPGSGKTTAVVRLLGLLQELALEQGRRLRIGLAAPTGKAAARLTETIGGAVGQLPEAVRGAIPTGVATVHRLLGSRPGTRRFRHHGQNPLHLDLLVVDEASMIDLEMMAAILEALPGEARLILLGDKDQLASVEAGSVLGDLCRNGEAAGYRPATIDWIAGSSGYRLDSFAGEGTHLDQHIVLLRRNHRFGEESGIGTLARAVNSGEPRKVAAAWGRGFGDIDQAIVQNAQDERFIDLVLEGGSALAGATVGYRAYLQRAGAGARLGESEADWMRGVLNAFGRFQMLAALRKGPWGVEALNGRTAEILRRAGLIDGRDEWYAGRPVMVVRNDYRLGLMNGDVGIVLPAGEENDSRRKNLRVVFSMPDGTLKTVRPSRLKEVETVYVMTVHKAQGSEFEHVVLIMPGGPGPVLTRELVYTGITRASRRFTLAGPRPDLLAHAVQRRTHRASGLGEMLTVS